MRYIKWLIILGAPFVVTIWLLELCFPLIAAGEPIGLFGLVFSVVLYILIAAILYSMFNHDGSVSPNVR